MQENFNQSQNTLNKLRTAIKKVIKGRDDTIDLVLCALFADGHVLLEDYPGSGKTVLTKTLGRLISSTVSEHIASFKRIQFTPDLLPGDVLGVNIFEPATAKFNFVRGPIFAHIILADEINRTGPKVQSAFLECMAEKQVTIDTVTHKLDELFFVIGTQNPLELAGTYPLPLVQLDRFLFKIPMSYVDAQSEFNILKEHAEIEHATNFSEPVCTREDIIATRKTVATVNIADSLAKAIVDILQTTRESGLLQFGASTRSGLMLQKALRSWAFMQERDYATEDDLKYLSSYVLLHRLKFHAAAGEPRAALDNLIKPVIERLARKI